MISKLQEIFAENNKRFDLFMDEYGPYITEWLTFYQNERTRESDRSEGAYLQLCDLLRDLETNENKPIKPEGQ